MTQKAFILHIKPKNIDRVQEALDNDQIIIGWSEASGLLDRDATLHDYRRIINAAHYPDETSLLKAGRASFAMWRFIREMSTGDLVVVPHRGNTFYVARVTGNPIYQASKVPDGTAYRRPVEWLNNKKPWLRSIVPSELMRAMKKRGTCFEATQFLEDIRNCIDSTLPEMLPKQPHREVLRRNLTQCYSISEIENVICFDLEIDYETLDGNNKESKISELIKYCERRQIIDKLIQKCKTTRPDSVWD